MSPLPAPLLPLLGAVLALLGIVGTATYLRTNTDSSALATQTFAGAAVTLAGVGFLFLSVGSQHSSTVFAGAGVCGLITLSRDARAFVHDRF